MPLRESGLKPHELEAFRRARSDSQAVVRETLRLSEEQKCEVHGDRLDRNCPKCEQRRKLLQSAASEMHKRGLND